MMKYGTGNNIKALVLFERISLSLALLVLIFLGGLAAILGLADMVIEDNNLVFDEHIFTLIHPHISDSNTLFFETISFFGSVGFLVPAYLFLIFYFLFKKKRRHDAWKVTVLSLTSTAVLIFLKIFLKRQRPLMPLISKLHDYSFPSGHSFSSLVFFGMLAYVSWKTVQNNYLKWFIILLLVLLVLAIGFSRVYLRVHFASDVIAGFCLGIVWLILAKWTLLKTETLPLDK